MLRLALLLPIACVLGCAARGGGGLAHAPEDRVLPAVRPQWWFRTGLGAGAQYDYHVKYTVEVDAGSALAEHEGRDRPVKSRSEADFRVAVEGAPDGPDRIVRLVPTDEPEATTSPLTTWLAGLGTWNETGLRVADDGLWLGEACVLRGPWAQGDRLTFGGALLFFRPHVGAIQAEVVEAGPRSVRLTFTQWGGDPMPTLWGSGEASITSDQHGVRDVRITSRWHRAQSCYQTTIEVHRKAIRTTD